MTDKTKHLKFKDITNQVFEPVSYYMKLFNDETYHGMTMHNHQYFEIMYTYSGSFVLQIFDPHKNGDIKEITICAGQFVIIDGFISHRMVMKKGGSAFVYNMELEPREPADYDPFGVNKTLKINYASFFKDTNFKSVANDKNGYVVLSDTQLVGTSLQEMILLLTDGINSIEDACSVRLAEIKMLTEISKCLNSVANGSLYYIKKANAYMQANYKHNVTLDEIALNVGLSKAYLQRQYKKHTGKTVLEQVNVLRANNAAELLIRSDLPIGKIALHVGFNNKNQFNYEFKKIYGSTPSLYRQQNTSFVDHHCKVHQSFPILLENSD